MKSLIFLLVLAISFVVTVKSDQDPDLQLDLLEPKGFQMTWKNPVGIRSAGIGGSIWFKPYAETENETYSGPFVRQSNGWLVYQNLTATLNPGDRILYVIADIIVENTEVDPDDLIIDMYTVPDNATRVHV